MRKARRTTHDKLIRYISITALTGAMAGAATYALMSGAIKAIQPEMPHSWTLAAMFAIELIGGIWLGWFFKENCDRDSEEKQVRYIGIKATYWTGRRLGSRQSKVTLIERSNRP